MHALEREVHGLWTKGWLTIVTDSCGKILASHTEPAAPKPLNVATTVTPNTPIPGPQDLAVFA